MTFGGKYYIKAKKIFDKGDIIEGVKVFKKGMDDGDVLCTCGYARRLQQGWGVLRDEKKAQQLYASVFKKLEQHNVDSVEGNADDLESIRWQGLLHRYYEEEYSPESAEFCYNYAAERGNVLAMEALAGFYYSDAYKDNSDKPMQNVPLALEWGLKAIANGSEDAYLTVAKCYLELKDKANFEKYVKLAEKKGSNNQLQLLGMWYYGGTYVQQDNEKAAKLLKAAGKAGDPYAMTYYAELMRLGNGVKQDATKALDILTELSAVSAEAMVLLGRSFEQGTGVEKNAKQALKWYKKAATYNPDYAQSFYDNLFAQTPEGKIEQLLQKAQNGYAQAYNDLGCIYKDGQGIKADPKKAMEYFKCAADMGHQYGEINYARCFMNGIGVKKDQTTAFKMMLQYANNGNMLAMNEVGLMYEDGIGTKQDYGKAVEMYKKATKTEGCNCYPFGNLGGAYYHGRGVTKDYQKAKEYFLIAVEKGNVSKYNYLASIFEEEQDYANMKKYCELAIKHGNQGENTRLGLMYFWAWGVKQDYAKAKKHFELGAKAGNLHAMSIIAEIYRRGLGVEVNHKKAFEWHKKAADKDSALDQYWVAEYYRGFGDLFEVDLKNAFAWHKKAADNGYANSNIFVAQGYLYGYGIQADLEKAYPYIVKAINNNQEDACFYMGHYFENKPNPEDGKAFEFYMRAANVGETRSIKAVGRCYENGLGVEINYAKAMDYYRKAQQAGLTEAYGDIGDMYYYGHGVPTSYKMALKYYRAGIDKNDRSCMYKLGALYYNGQGVEKDRSQAYYWIYQAACQGNVVAMYQVARCLEKGIGIEVHTKEAMDWYKAAAFRGNEQAKKRLTELGIKW